MAQSELVDRVLGSRITGVLAARPRLLTFLLLVTLLLAVQGGAAAAGDLGSGDCTFCATTSGDDNTTPGP